MRIPPPRFGSAFMEIFLVVFKFIIIIIIIIIFNVPSLLSFLYVRLVANPRLSLRNFSAADFRVRAARERRKPGDSPRLYRGGIKPSCPGISPSGPQREGCVCVISFPAFP